MLLLWNYMLLLWYRTKLNIMYKLLLPTNSVFYLYKLLHQFHNRDNCSIELVYHLKKQDIKDYQMSVMPPRSPHVIKLTKLHLCFWVPAVCQEALVTQIVKVIVDGIGAFLRAESSSCEASRRRRKTWTNTLQSLLRK